MDKQDISVWVSVATRIGEREITKTAGSELPREIGILTDEDRNTNIVMLAARLFQAVVESGGENDDGEM